MTSAQTANLIEEFAKVFENSSRAAARDGLRLERGGAGAHNPSDPNGRRIS
ncbi:hypothetical protein Salmuc_03972 [Salipiger mucosus DSM 16094]|uniref:Uncharacterized protein n=1 Tax=Salipiger mucosus DSM 16094 TaxID=1123237 RepID=S9QAF1_9RHOB|nr:hypothetical protein Salmuc_03972 [Salipiger mucosus DSM 16094]